MENNNKYNCKDFYENLNRDDVTIGIRRGEIGKGTEQTGLGVRKTRYAEYKLFEA